MNVMVNLHTYIHLYNTNNHSTLLNTYTYIDLIISLYLLKLLFNLILKCILTKLHCYLFCLRMIVDKGDYYQFLFVVEGETYSFTNIIGMTCYFLDKWGDPQGRKPMYTGCTNFFMLVCVKNVLHRRVFPSRAFYIDQQTFFGYRYGKN